MATPVATPVAAQDPTLLMGGQGESSGVALIGWLPLIANFADAWQKDPRAVWSSFAMIQVSELGDKTFLIAAILAMRQSRLTIFLGAFAALALMSVLSAFLGVVFPTLLPKALTTLLASILFFLFGARMLQEGLKMEGNEMDEEWQQAAKEIEGQDDDEHEMERLEEALAEEEEEPTRIARPNLNRRTSGAPEANGHAAPRRASVSSAPRGGIKEGAKNLLSLCFSPVFAQAFVLTFLGEWGDRSQIATIALAAAHNVALVSFGTIAGHAVCTTAAVTAGSWLASHISVKHVTLGGAALFLVFGFIYLYESFSDFHDPAALGLPVSGLTSSVSAALATETGGPAG